MGIGVCQAAACRLTCRLKLQDSHILAAVPLMRRNVLDTPVSMNHVIPIGEGMHPVTCRFQCGKAMAWKAR